ncbi:hypothetical protein [Haliovirga abyssi]|uniref:Uncharacterized protein n=1 Tax=Haliovirga abyssi TaxID=2996794 RepID=A0AAU9DYA4_9FUSO|nr:hypothetical protein [Haliovirga abyssi]BDU50405.1 hypothetical protein HLVA_09740 [Haliovirga abyssi]
MKKIIKAVLIIITSIILIVIIAGIYKFNYLANQPGYDVDGNKIEEVHKSEVLSKWFNLDTTNDFYVKVPELKINCKITQVIDSDSLYYAKGKFSVGYEKGKVFISNREIVTLNNSTSNINYLVIPFSVSNQGSGLFKYIGLFKLNNKAKTINHIDSYFLGDRVKIDSIEYDGANNIQVKIKIHTKNQAMSEAPSELKLLEFKVRDGGLFGFKLLK